MAPVSAGKVLARTLYGGSLMRMVTRIFPVAALALGLAAGQLPAQQAGNSPFQWYVGGQGGVMNFETPMGGHFNKPLGGAHLLVTAKRTGLLLSVEQAFGSDQAGSYNVTVVDSVGFITSSNDFLLTWNSLRKYSAMLMAFPIRGPMTPYFGLGVGIMHTVGHNPDDGSARAVGSSGFGSLIGGLNFRVSHFSAFGQYQITSGPSLQVLTDPGPQKSTIITSGNLFKGPTHTFSAGLRFGLGNARERTNAGGY
jgi:hypothetical protein